jgi:hypothetical protein
LSIFLPEEFQMRKAKNARPGSVAHAMRAVSVTQVRYSLAKFDVSELPASPAVVDAAPEVDLNDYVKDDHPRIGCRMVVELREKGWQLSVYAPGYGKPPVGGCISSYFTRPYGSMGVALDAFAAGKTVRSVFKEMAAAERAYSSVSPSAVTK